MPQVIVPLGLALEPERLKLKQVRLTTPLSIAKHVALTYALVTI
jgi:hypothetical protein